MSFHFKFLPIFAVAVALFSLAACQAQTAPQVLADPIAASSGTIDDPYFNYSESYSGSAGNWYGGSVGG